MTSKLTLKWEDLRASPLACNDTEPEEAAVWLDMQGMTTTSKLKNVFMLVEEHYGGPDDLHPLPLNHAVLPLKHPAYPVLPTWASMSVSWCILQNLFKAVFKAGVIRTADDAASLKKYAVKRADSLKAEMSRDGRRPKAYESDMLEAYLEMQERLDTLIEELDMNGDKTDDSARQTA